jgi:hypothetical protein
LVEIKKRDELFALLELAYSVDELGPPLRGHLAARILVEEVAVLGGLEPRLFGYLGLHRRTPELPHQPARGLLYLPGALLDAPGQQIVTSELLEDGPPYLGVQPVTPV